MFKLLEKNRPNKAKAEPLLYEYFSARNLHQVHNSGTVLFDSYI